MHRAPSLATLGASAGLVLIFIPYERSFPPFAPFPPTRCAGRNATAALDTDPAQDERSLVLESTLTLPHFVSLAPPDLYNCRTEKPGTLWPVGIFTCVHSRTNKQATGNKQRNKRKQNERTQPTSEQQNESARIQAHKESNEALYLRQLTPYTAARRPAVRGEAMRRRGRARPLDCQGELQGSGAQERGRECVCAHTCECFAGVINITQDKEEERLRSQ